MGIRGRLLVLLLSCLTFSGNASYDYIFEHFSTGNGLSHGSVSAMLKDKKGFMWFATWDGINRFDGNSFKTFKPGNGNQYSYSSNRVESLREDVYGNIWIATYDNYVFRWNRLTENLEPMPDGTMLNQSALRSVIYTTASGDVWLPTSNSGIYRVITDSITNLTQIQYLNANTNGLLPGNTIFFVGEDSLQNIWLSTNKGILGIAAGKNKKTIATVTLPPETVKLLSQIEAHSFYADKTNVYFGTTTGEVVQLETASFKLRIIRTGNSFPISTITGTGTGIIYFGTSGNGIYEYQEYTNKIINHYLHANMHFVLKMYVSSQNMLWVESTKAGFSKIDLYTGKYRHYQQILDVNQEIRYTAQCGLMEDRNQTVWLTLKGGGFGFYNKETDEVEYFFNKPGHPESKVSNYVNCFYMDSTDVLWLSTYFKGIEKITMTKKQFGFVQPSPQTDFSIANEVRAIFEDSKGILWIATKKQELYLIDDNFHIINKIDAINGQKTGMIYCIFEDRTGNMYLGTKGNGLFKLSRNSRSDFSFQHFVNNPADSTSLSNNNIYSIFEDSRNRLWVGTYGGGINLLINGRFLHHGNTLNGYPQDNGSRVRYIHEDRNGNIWAGTTNGIVLIEQNTTNPAAYNFSFFNKENGGINGLRSNDIFWIYRDHRDTMWMAALGGGLAKLTAFNPEIKKLDFDVITKDDGLPSDMVFTILEDKFGNLWMSTENGIALYNPTNNVFRNYNQYDGIVNSGFSEAACAIRNDGSFCFGANHGLYYFNPADFGPKQRQIHLEFVAFQLFGKEIFPGEGSVLSKSITETELIQLKHNQNVFSISWAGLDFSMKDKISYACMLEGFETNWRLVNERNTAEFTKIPPGKYTFMVRFNNPELQALNPQKSIIIEILPPIWKTTWAYVIYLIVFILLVETARRIVTSMIRLRNKVVIEKELSEIKLNFFTNISHELRTPLTLILGPATELQKTENLTERGKSYAGSIEQNAQRLLRLVNQLLDFRKIQSKKMELALNKVNIGNFVTNVCQNFNEMAIERNIDFAVQCATGNLFVLVDEEKLDSVVFNLLSNAFKFTPDNGRIMVKVIALPNESAIVIDVVDTGMGVAKEIENSLFNSFASHYGAQQHKISGTGIGLALAKELVLLHHGDLSYMPTPGGGATFRIRLKSIELDIEETKTNQKIGKLPAELIIKPEEQASKTVKHALPLVLIVEDNHELRNFIRLQLTDYFVVEEAVNGLQGLEMARNLQPDIILSDIMMPVMDGIVLLDNLKNDFDTSHIPIVLLTAKNSIESKIEGLRYGADAYLTKPFNNEELIAQLKNLLHQRILLRERFATQPQENESALGFTVTDKDAEFLQSVRTIIEENLSKVDFKIETIYKQVGMGRSKFFDKLKGLTGLSPIDFVREYRLNKAKNILQSGECNVTEVAYLSGFSDSGYFSKCFKERFGVNPSQFVKKQG